MGTINHPQLTASISFDDELDRLLRLLAVQRAVERQIRTSVRRETAVGPLLKRGETVEAQAVLAAQLRARRRPA